MNIFITDIDIDPKQCAINLCDKHVNKMLLESCQLLCSQFEINVAPYKRTHYNHPCSKWCRNSIQNYEWLLHHAYSLSEEYSFRYKKYHKCNNVLNWVYENYKKYLKLEDIGLTEFVIAMPYEYRINDDVVQSYRNYYIKSKSKFAKWNNGRLAPDWYII